MDIIRKIVLATEAKADGLAGQPLSIDGATEAEVGYHSYLLVDAGLATGVDLTHLGSNGPEYVVGHLTWAGHDFADACRNETIWNKAKATIKDGAGSATFGVLKEVLTWLAKGAIGLG